MTRLPISALSIAVALGALSAGCSSTPQDEEPASGGAAAVQTALGRVLKCPPGEELTCDPSANGRGAVCDCAFPPPASVRAASEAQPEILKKCPPGMELTCDPGPHGIVCDCAYPPSSASEVQPELLKKCPPGMELTCDPGPHGIVCDCAFPP